MEIAELTPAIDYDSNSPMIQQKLASRLGYPKGWHVVRTFPHPCTPSNTKSYCDRIYAGDPSTGVDLYYNHSAALSAAMSYIPGESSGYEKKGGQMLPRKPKFKVNEVVEVLYEDDGKWYQATIQKSKIFVDDIRYSVHYEDEDATQNNISEDLIRKSDGTITTSSSSTSTPKEKKKRGRKPGSKNKKKRAKKSISDAVEMTSPRKRKKPTRLEDEQLAERKESKTSSNYYNKRRKIQRGRSANSGFGLPPEEIARLRQKGEEGDPAWRRSDHSYLNQSVRYVSEDNPGKYQIGTITGWLSETDVDSNGDPAFISEISNVPAKLFHITFKPSQGDVLFVDLEEWEVQELLDNAKGMEELEDEEDPSNSDNASEDNADADTGTEDYEDDK